MTPDPNLWLEDVEGQAALDWVRAQNAEAMAALAEAPGRVNRADHRTHRHAGDAGHFVAALAQHLEHADVRQPARAAGAEHDRDPDTRAGRRWPRRLTGHARAQSP